jgi:16S rRNA G966 N2-methylase RsmD
VQVTFVERTPAALKVLRANLERLKITKGFWIHSGSVASFLRKPQAGAATFFDVVFLDPPYGAADQYSATLGLLGGASAGLLATGAMVIAEHRRKEQLESRYGALERIRLLEQGDTTLSFFAAKTVPEPG